MPEIKPCPFCGETFKSGNLQICGRYIECIRRGAYGPDGDNATDADAIAAWNRRVK